MKIPTAMDDSSVSHHNGGQVGSQIGVSVNNKQNDEPSQSIQYSIPGILHFIQHEWARFELERSQWEVDRAEFEARIAFLQGERKGQENLKNDLVRRIKMLEYALKQERAKFHKLKYGVELQQGDVRPPPEEPAEPEPAERAQWKQGRQLIKQYLQEIGYTDTILDVRSNRVRALLGLNNEEVENPNYRNYDKQQHDRCDYSMNHMVRKYDYDTGKEPRKSGVSAGGGYNEEGLSVQETAAVFANFEFLTNQEMDMDEIDDLDAKQSHHPPGKQGEEVDHEAEEVLNELNLLTEREADGGGQGDEYPVGSAATAGSTVGAGAGAGAGEADEEPLALGELAQLTVSNEPEAYDVASANKESFRKTWNAKYTLRSHFDGVRALAFHPTEAALVTASEDHTLKLWNLQRTVPAKKSAGLDVEPLYTFRAHTAPVLCLAMGAPRSEECFSGGLDGTIRVWNLPPPTADPYDPYDPAVQGAVLREHTDAVWSLSSAHGRLLSSSADGTVRLWAPRAARPLLATLRADESPAAPAPAAADFADAASRAAVVYRDGTLLLYDLETGQVVLRVSCDSPAHRVRSHPTLPLLVTAHEDRHIRFWDGVSGRCAHAMVAHLDAVTGLALDPNGLFLLSGSHDCSVRLWNLDTKTCVQEITAHRKKFDESILDVAFHPLRPYIASAGADGLAKVFV
ncbi:striatin-3 isoform X1 [Helicoverpa armigera]|uniref:striatin-3 isoform X1 n=1 Tax=Helicoverpa zea TaxID=7113 RepID=UPI001F567ED5|nr:striatin-3 isoform X1 [Helicoverpa zea]XP_049696583.1 striatin-3 isoform X1 [Helicoverpa armigera]